MTYEIAIVALCAVSVALVFALLQAHKEARYWRREHALLDAYFAQYRRNSIRRDRKTGRYIKED